MSTVTTRRRAVKVPAPLTVRLPDIDTVPEAYRGEAYVVRELLTAGDSNPKLRKSDATAAFNGYKTVGLSLAPAHESGYQLCPQASDGCRAACLFKQGRGAHAATAAARIARTIAFKQHRDWFEERLRYELGHARKKAVQAGYRLAFRPNVYSDIRWETELPWLFTDFVDVFKYDYTKLYRRMLRFILGKLPPNYHLTFSRSEANDDEALDILYRGGNVAVVFAGELPKFWCGYPVVNGDETDLRFLDPTGSGHVVGLKAKGTARRDTSGFVVLPRID